MVIRTNPSNKFQLDTPLFLCHYLILKNHLNHRTLRCPKLFGMSHTVTLCQLDFGLQSLRPPPSQNIGRFEYPIASFLPQNGHPATAMYTHQISFHRRTSVERICFRFKTIYIRTTEFPFFVDRPRLPTDQLKTNEDLSRLTIGYHKSSNSRLRHRQKDISYRHVRSWAAGRSVPQRQAQP